jgi:hypothetical protein
VVFITGDQHWGGSFKTTYAGRPRYEFLASGFNSSFLGAVSRAADPVNGPVFWKLPNKFNFGLVSVDTTVSPPTVSFQAYDPTGSLGSSYRTNITADDINQGLIPTSATVGATSRRSTASASTSITTQTTAAGTSRRATAQAFAGLAPTVTVAHGLSRRSTASATGHASATSATVAGTSRRSTAAVGAMVTTTAHAGALSRRSTAAAYAGLVPTVGVVRATSRRSTAAVVASITQQAIAGAAAMSRRSVGSGVATGFSNTKVTEPGRIALFPAEQRTARFAV